jgi:hypothetical protein
MGIIKNDAMNHGLLLGLDGKVAVFECEGCGDDVSEPGLCWTCYQAAEAMWMMDRDRDLEWAKEHEGD